MSYSYVLTPAKRVFQNGWFCEDGILTETRTTIDHTLHFTDQMSLQEAPLFIRRRKRVARGTTTKREHVLWHAGWYECRHTRELHFGRVDRVVFNRAHLLADEDYYECRI